MEMENGHRPCNSSISFPFFPSQEGENWISLLSFIFLNKKIYKVNVNLPLQFRVVDSSALIEQFKIHLYL